MNLSKGLRLVRAIVSCIGMLVVAGMATASSMPANAMPANAMVVQPYSSVTGAGKIMIWSNAKAIAERECLAFALYHEARGEPYSGQIAVAATVLNRVKSKAYPSSICAVVYQNARRRNACQFSFACDGKSDVPKRSATLERMRRMAGMAIAGTLWREAQMVDARQAGSLSRMTHYHRHDVKPLWSPKLERLTRIGDHLFLHSRRVTSRYN